MLYVVTRAKDVAHYVETLIGVFSTMGGAMQVGELSFLPGHIIRVQPTGINVPPESRYYRYDGTGWQQIDGEPT